MSTRIRSCKHMYDAEIPDSANCEEIKKNEINLQTLLELQSITRLIIKWEISMQLLWKFHGMLLLENKQVIGTRLNSNFEEISFKFTKQTKEGYVIRIHAINSKLPPLSNFLIF